MTEQPTRDLRPEAAPAGLPARSRRLLAALIPLTVCGLLLVPHLFRGVAPGLVFGTPWIFSGDEPAYLVMITSLIQDHDLDISNNYESVHAGGLDAGRRWGELRLLDHHVSSPIGSKQVFWERTYKPGAPFAEWQPDEFGRMRPPLLPGAVAIPPGTPEYSTHQPGIAYLLAPVLYPLRGTRWIESGAVVCSGLAVVGAFLFFRMLLRGYTSKEFVLNVVSVVAFLCTPVWFYGRALFMESFLLFFLCGAYALALRRNLVVLPGIFLALAFQLKAYTVVMALPLALDLALRREYRKGLVFCALTGLGVLAVLVQNKIFYGSFLTGPQPFVVGSLQQGAWGQLFSPRFGLFFLAPAALVAFWCWPRFVRAFPREGGILGAAFLLQYLMMSLWMGWAGAVYGPRHLVPVMGFLFAALATPGPHAFACKPLGKGLVYGLFAVSAAINGYAALYYMFYWLRNPVLEMAAWLRG